MDEASISAWVAGARMRADVMQGQAVVMRSVRERLQNSLAAKRAATEALQSVARGLNSGRDLASHCAQAAAAVTAQCDEMEQFADDTEGRIEALGQRMREAIVAELKQFFDRCRDAVDLRSRDAREGLNDAVVDQVKPVVARVIKILGKVEKAASRAERKLDQSVDKVEKPVMQLDRLVQAFEPLLDLLKTLA